MELDNEDIPTLVGVDNAPDKAHVEDAPAAQLQDLSLTKVPLTIITGLSGIN